MKNGLPENAFEAMAINYPDGIDMSDAEMEEKVGLATHGDSWKFTMKNPAQSSARYAYYELTNKYPRLNISENTVKNYLVIFPRLTASVIQAVMDKKIPVSDILNYIQWIDKPEQEKLAEAAGTDEYGSLLDTFKRDVNETRGKYWKKPAPRYLPYYYTARQLKNAVSVYNRSKDLLQEPETLQERNYKKKLEEILREIKVLESMDYK